MNIGIPKEIFSGEKRVASTPEAIEKIIKLGFSVSVESGAGIEASFSDLAYENAGAKIISDVKKLWNESGIILKVRAPTPEEILLMPSGQTLISFIWPGQNSDLMQAFVKQKVSVLAMDCIPRISRAQKLDALSSMANIAGYRAIIEAAHHFGRFFTGQITAAGKIPPAQVFVIGAGVAGLSAIGTASSLGAIVKANDTRLEVADQVRSMGGQYVPITLPQTTTAAESASTVGGYAKTMSAEYLAAQASVFAEQAQKADIIITTALIPGKTAPVLITEAMVKSMKSGSVIVDLAAEQGGNCALTKAGQVINCGGVTIIGYTDLPSRLARQASTLYATNIFRLLEDMSTKKNGLIEYSMDDEVLGAATIVRSGLLFWPIVQLVKPLTIVKSEQVNDLKKTTDNVQQTLKVKSEAQKSKMQILGFLVLIALIFAVGLYGSSALISQITVFVLACFIGYQVVWNVSASLHTPLMSVTNAISSIVIIGAILQVSSEQILVQILSLAAVTLTSMNMFGGFAVTRRMLEMFKK